MSECPKAAKPINRVVAVIANRADVRKAIRLHKRPDLFELRLDALCDCLDEIENAMEPRVSYGVMWTEATMEVLHYLAAISVSKSERVPEGMSTITLAAGKYASFRYPLSGLAQFTPQNWGCYVMDVDSKTLCAYQFFPSTGKTPALRLVAARKIAWDMQLGEFNSGEPTPEGVRQMIEAARIPVRGASGSNGRRTTTEPSDSPEKQDRSDAGGH